MLHYAFTFNNYLYRSVNCWYSGKKVFYTSIKIINVPTIKNDDSRDSLVMLQPPQNFIQIRIFLAQCNFNISNGWGGASLYSSKIIFDSHHLRLRGRVSRFTLNHKSLQKLYLNEVIKAEGGRGLHVWWIVQRPKFGSWSPQPRPIWWQNVKFEWWVTWPLLQCPLIKQTWVKHVQCKKQIFIFYILSLVH